MEREREKGGGGGRAQGLERGVKIKRKSVIKKVYI